MDWSDDVAYSVHDVEDGLHAGPPRPQLPARRARAAATIFAVADRPLRTRDTDPAELAEALDRLLDQEWWPHGYDGSAVAQARLKDATSQLIGRFCLAAEGATRAAYGSGRLTRYAAELVVPRAARLECAVLKAVADRYVMQRADQERLRADQRIVLAELAEALTRPRPGGPRPAVPRAVRRGAPDDRARKRVVVDQIAVPHRRLGPLPARPSHPRRCGSADGLAGTVTCERAHFAEPLRGPLGATYRCSACPSGATPPGPLPAATLRCGTLTGREQHGSQRGGIKWSTHIGHSSSSEEGWPGRRRPRRCGRRASPAG